MTTIIALNALFAEFVSASLSQLSAGVESHDEMAKSLTDSWNSVENQEKLTSIIGKSTKRATKPKAKKDKNAPKKAKTAYNLFSAEERENIKAEVESGKLEKMSAKAIISEIAARWQKVKADGDISKFVDLAAKDKERYQEEIKDYVPSETPVDVEKEKKKSDKPKRKKTAYMFFCTEQRAVTKAANPGMDSKEITKVLKALWAEIKCTDVGKSYFDLAENQPMSATDKAPRKKAGPKKRTGPKKPKNAYMFYMSEERKIVKSQFPDLDSKELTSKMASLWKDIKKNDKEKLNYYVALSNDDKSRYDNEVAEQAEKHFTIDEDEENDLLISNEQIIRNIIDNFGGAEVTLKMIRHKLKEMDVDVEKDEFKSIIEKINKERESAEDSDDDNVDE
jgi:hypothetical protein